MQNMISFFKKTKSKTTKKTDTKKEWFQPEGELAIDIFETDSEIIIQSTIAGIKTDDLEVYIENNMLTIKGSREKPSVQSSDSFKKYLYQECYWGPFSRQAILPEEASDAEAQAGIEDGILTITVPKIQKERRKKIAIKEKK